jgi:hypothetical protein
VKALKKANLEYTRIFVGTFMDYWGMPNTRTHIGYFGFGVEISSARALIPGDGNDVFTVTYSYDMARFIVGLLDLESWPETCHFSGDDITFNQILDQAQRLRGKLPIQTARERDSYFPPRLYSANTCLLSR